MIMLKYLNSWRRMRRATHEALTKRMVQRYQPIQTKEAIVKEMMQQRCAAEREREKIGAKGNEKRDATLWW